MRDYISSYVGRIEGDGELILLAYIITDNAEDWKRIYYSLYELKHGDGRRPDPDVNTLTKNYKKRFME